MNLMTAKSKNVKKKAIDKQDAFIEFKNEEHARMLEDSIRDNRNELKNMKSSYRLKTADRGGDGKETPTGKPDGSYALDFEYVAGSGDLDEFGGRTGVTPEFPKGTYYYVLTEEFPFIPRKFKGTPEIGRASCRERVFRAV